MKLFRFPVKDIKIPNIFYKIQKFLGASRASVIAHKDLLDLIIWSRQPLLNNGLIKLYFSVLPSSKGYISRYTPQGVYRLIFIEIYEGIMRVMIGKMIYCAY